MFGDLLQHMGSSVFENVSSNASSSHNNKPIKLRALDFIISRLHRSIRELAPLLVTLTLNSALNSKL
jgi:hypothetical protein